MIKMIKRPRSISGPPSRKSSRLGFSRLCGAVLLFFLSISFSVSAQEQEKPAPAPQNKGERDSLLLPPLPVVEIETPSSTMMECSFDYSAPPAYDLHTLKALLKYPKEPGERKLKGEVTVKVGINKWGKAEDVIILHSTDTLFNESVRKAVEAMRFTPGVQNGHAVKTSVVFTIAFKLQGSQPGSGNNAKNE